MLAKIHIATKALRISRSDYSRILWQYGYQRPLTDFDPEADASSKYLDDAGLARVLEHFKYLGFRNKRKPTAGQDSGKQGMLAKIDAILTEAGRPRAYADGIARKRFGVQHVHWLDIPQIYKVLQMLIIDQNRRHAALAKEGKAHD